MSSYSAVPQGRRAMVLLLLLALVTAGWLAVGAPRSAADDDGSTIQAHPKRVTTKTWLNVNRTYVIRGEKVELVANVEPRMPRRVVIQRKRDGQWRNFESGRTNAQGQLHHQFIAGKRSFPYRVVAPRLRTRGKLFRFARSEVESIESVKQKASLVMRVSSSGDTIEGTVQANPLREGRPVRIQVRGDRRWTTLAKGRLNEVGTRRFTFLRAGDGMYTFRAVVNRWHGAAKVVSGTEALAITRPHDRTPPAAPANLRAEAGDTLVALNWDKVDSKDVAGYVIYTRRVGSQTWSTTLIHENVGSARVRELANGTAYQFKVSAVDAFGNESGRTAAVVSTPVAG